MGYCSSNATARGASRLDDGGRGTILLGMRAIVPPPSGIHPDRFLQCQEALSDGLSDVALAAIAAGWRPEEVAAALVELADYVMLGVLATQDFERTLAVLRKR